MTAQSEAEKLAIPPGSVLESPGERVAPPRILSTRPSPAGTTYSGLQSLRGKGYKLREKPEQRKRQIQLSSGTIGKRGDTKKEKKTITQFGIPTLFLGIVNDLDITIGEHIPSTPYVRTSSILPTHISSMLNVMRCIGEDAIAQTIPI